ncbi:MAG: hypothetical protein ACI4RO_00825, partial [Candidatus Scatosoma sp.]
LRREKEKTATKKRSKKNAFVAVLPFSPDPGGSASVFFSALSEWRRRKKRTHRVIEIRRGKRLDFF